MVVDGDTADKARVVPAHLWEYATSFESLLRAADSLETHLSRMLDESAVVPFLVQARAKSLHSFQLKSERRHDGIIRYADPLSDITDCIAARIITYSGSDKQRVCEVIREQLCPIEDKDPGAGKPNGYSSQHFLIGPGVWNDRLTHLSQYYLLHSSLEVQVRTVAEHAWAEYEHHVRFKPDGEGAYNSLVSEDKSRIDLLLAQASGNRDDMDKKFGAIEQILHPVARRSVDSTSPVPGRGTVIDSGPGALDPARFQLWLDLRYPDSTRSSDGAVSWMIGVLGALGVNSASRLHNALMDVDSESVAALIEYRFPPGQVRRLDDDLLAAFGPEYISANNELDSAAPNRQRILSWRWGRLDGKLQIYSFAGESVPSDLQDIDLSASAALRQAIALVADLAAGPRDALIPGVISFDNDLAGPTRATPVSAPEWTLWVQANLTRQMAEEHVSILLGRLPSSCDVTFKRAGEVLWSSDRVTRRTQASTTSSPPS